MSCVRVPRENTSSLENYMKSRPHLFLNGLRPNRSEGRAVRKEGEDSSMSVEDEFEETRRALHRMLKDAFEGKLGVSGNRSSTASRPNVARRGSRRRGRRWM